MIFVAGGLLLVVCTCLCRFSTAECCYLLSFMYGLERLCSGESHRLELMDGDMIVTGGVNCMS